MDSQTFWTWVGAGPVVYLAPHSDDAAFSSAGVLHACARLGIPVRVVTCFSRSGHARNGLGPDPAIVSEARKAEDRRFFGMLPGPVEPSWLDLEDAPLRPQHLARHPCRETAMTPADEETVVRIEELASAALSGATVVLAPLGVGRHIDHLIVRDVAVALTRKGVRVGFWEDLPYAGRVPLDDLQREIETSMRSTGLALRPCLVADAKLKEQKTQALRCYPSQVIDVHRRGVLVHMRRVAGSGTPAERVWLTDA